MKGEYSICISTYPYFMSKISIAKKSAADAESYHLDFTPYYLLNGILPVFWFTYLGIAATFVVVNVVFEPTITETMWVPILYYTLATAFLALTISCTIMANLIKDFDSHRAVQIMKIPVFVALIFFGLRFLVPTLQYIQALFVGQI